MAGVSIRDHQVEDLKIFKERNALKLTSDEPMRSRLLWAMCPTLYLLHPPCIRYVHTLAYDMFPLCCICEVSLRIPRWGQLWESHSEMSYEASYRYFVPIQAIISWLVSVPSTDLAALKINIIFFDLSHLEKASLYEVILEWLLPHRIVSRLP